MTNLLKELHGFRDNAKAEKVCALCQKVVNPETDFKDEISKREYAITATCQTCQDEIFTSEDDCE